MFPGAEAPGHERRPAIAGLESTSLFPRGLH
jgi:hypothetical protein